MGSPFPGGLREPVPGQAEVPDLLPSWPLQGSGRFLTFPKSEVDWASRPRSGTGSNVILDLPG